MAHLKHPCRAAPYPCVGYHTRKRGSNRVVREACECNGLAVSPLLATVGHAGRL